ncbi:MAG: response regulator [Cryobacterium sp.]|nr:response regulator [Oligoflexia bacterium]
MKCKTLLIAEDNTDIRESIAYILEAEGYDVRSATNGKEALELLKLQDKPTLVLLDLMMPVMTGWEFLERTQADLDIPEHRVVILSAVARQKTPEGFLPVETAAQLTKPVDLNHLLRTVRTFCGSPDSSDDNSSVTAV